MSDEILSDVDEVQVIGSIQHQGEERSAFTLLRGSPAGAAWGAKANYFRRFSNSVKDLK